MPCPLWLSGGSLPAVSPQGVKTMRCDKDGFTKCCGILELVFPCGVEEACLLEGTFTPSFGLMNKCSPGEEEGREF